MGRREWKIPVSITCFIAMAFGHKDSDFTYDRYILPTLKSMDIKPVRVDRKQHKDDLNNYIIRMIRESDIVLADLTYARPSVYDEAGFAECMKPVVYTARSDHLSRSQPNDRRRVHFDLEMKKIITWRHINDKNFTARLKQRVSYLVAPIRRRRQLAGILKKDSREFQSRSVVARCEFLCKAFGARLKSKRFWTGRLLELNRGMA